MNKPRAKVYVVLVNYNGHQDTVECLESLYDIDCSDFKIIVVDNSQNTASLKFIKDWADGTNPAAKKEHCPIEIKTINKPLKYTFVDSSNTKIKKNDERLIIIKAKKNKGFAAANNLAINYLDNDYDWVWLLNNDTVVDKHCLKAFHQYLNSDFNYQEGVLGNDLYYYKNPDVLQGIGGTYNKWWGTSKHVIDVPEECNLRRQIFDDKVRYVIGASMFISRQFINDVGLMDENYFLYFEEIDWATRGKALNYKLGYICNCKVYHKEGASIGSSTGAKKTELADFYSLRNRLVFTKKFNRNMMPTVYLSLLLSAIIRLYRRQFKRIKMISKIIFTNGKYHYNIIK